MRNFIFAIIILLLIATNVFSTTLPNESIEDYKIRYKEEFKPPQTVCGDNLCEGLEFEMCARDCKNQSQISQETQDTYQSSAKKNIWLEISLFVVIVVSAAIFIVYYILRFRKKRAYVITDAWEELGVSKDYFLKIESYIKSQLNRGFQSEAIKKSLVDSGHNAQVIDKIFDWTNKK